jgi:diguanylate cyclase (GGDEF)-like protein
MNSSFVVDLPTLCAVTGFITVTGGLLMLFSWMQNRSVPALALWGLGYLLASTGAALIALRGLIAPAWSVCCAIALICCAYGLVWAGSRLFEGRHVRVRWIVAGAILWIGACQIHSFFDSAPARVMLGSAILATYAMLSAREVWYARDRELISRWPTLALLILHGSFLLARIPFASALTFPAIGDPSSRPAMMIMAFESLFVVFCLAFLRVSMAKERAELEQRRAALTDALTGIANRRAFFDRGEPLLDRAIADRRSAALLLFDLDRFKEVNDTAGHQCGDGVLKAFANLVTASMRPGDLFGRLGGEEFACLLVDASMTEALQIAEQVRCAFAAMRFSNLATNVTVSTGIAMTSEAGKNLQALLAIADRALYRAKAEGRNRVAPAPLVLINTGDREAARQPAEFGRPIANVSAMAGSP